MTDPTPDPSTDPSTEPSTEPALTRVSVNLGPLAVANLNHLMTRRSTNRTDAVTRALAVADLVDQLTDERGSLRIVAEDGTTERIYLV